ncbi:MAG TPA: hypothetical protein VGP82_04425, partial [Ktedonobacterales bacterium]|nr:hypothetical protein [Ktedonobacterales bacterium]
MRHRYLSWARLLRVLRPLLLAAVGGLALTFYNVLPLSLPGQASSTAFVAQACGLGNTPTMLAGKIPALLYPVTKDTPKDVPIGIFAQPFLTNKAITFDEDFSAMLTA